MVERNHRRCRTDIGSVPEKPSLCVALSARAMLTACHIARHDDENLGSREAGTNLQKVNIARFPGVQEVEREFHGY